MLPMALLGADRAGGASDRGAVRGRHGAGDVLPRPRPDGPTWSGSSPRCCSPSARGTCTSAASASSSSPCPSSSRWRSPVWCAGRRAGARCRRRWCCSASALYTYVPAKLIVPLFLAGFAAALPRAPCWRAGARSALAAAPARSSRSRRRRSSTCAIARKRAATSATPRCWRVDEPPLELTRTFARQLQRVLLAPVPVRSQQRPDRPPQRRRPRPALPVLRAAAHRRRRRGTAAPRSRHAPAAALARRSIRSRRR